MHYRYYNNAWMLSLSAMASRNEVNLTWVLGDCGIPGNETAGKLARQGAAMPLLSPQQILGISRVFSKGSY
jgi:ribonuclease HI